MPAVKLRLFLDDLIRVDAIATMRQITQDGKPIRDEKIALQSEAPIGSWHCHAKSLVLLRLAANLVSTIYCIRMSLGYEWEKEVERKRVRR